MIVETRKTYVKNDISIRRYFDPGSENMGLEKYELVVHDGVGHTEQLTCLEKNGVKRYLTGLDEFAPEVQKIQDEEKKKAVIKDIRETVSYLEKMLATNIINVDDPEFWNKVTMLRKDNSSFWDQITITCGNEPTPLDPENPMDLIKIKAIEAGGFSIVAKSLEDARARNVPPKWYLDRYSETATTRTEVTKLRNKAIAELEKLYAKDFVKLFFIAKVVDGNGIQYKRTTPNDVIYENLDSFIQAKGVETSRKRAPEKFLDACKLTTAELKVKAIVKDAAFYKKIILKGDGMMYHTNTATMMGKNINECVEFLKNPLNDQIFANLQGEMEKMWGEVRETKE